MSSVSGNIQHVVCAGRVRPHLWPFTKSEMTASAYGSFHFSEREQLPHCFHHDHDSIVLLLWLCQTFSLSVADGNPKISLGWGLEAKKHQFQNTSVINLCPTHIFFKTRTSVCCVILCLKSAQWLRKSLLDSTECVFSCKIASFLHCFKLVLNKMVHAGKTHLGYNYCKCFPAEGKHIIDMDNIFSCMLMNISHLNQVAVCKGVEVGRNNLECCSDTVN